MICLLHWHVFPDYLYACGDEHDAGEEAHWTPFQIASVNYIREKYPDWATQDRLEDGPGLVAFTLVLKFVLIG